jgi:hypothetical protein
LLLYSSHLPLGVPNGLVIYHASVPDPQKKITERKRGKELTGFEPRARRQRTPPSPAASVPLESRVHPVEARGRRTKGSGELASTTAERESSPSGAESIATVTASRGFLRRPRVLRGADRGARPPQPPPCGTEKRCGGEEPRQPPPP